MKRLLFILSLSAFALADVASATSLEPVAFVTLVKKDGAKNLAVALAADHGRDFARHGLHHPRFFTEIVGTRQVLLCTSDLETDRNAGEAWQALRNDSSLKPWWSAFDAAIDPHPSASAGNPWVHCETICKLRPEVPASVRGNNMPTWQASVTGLKPEKEVEYRLLHSNVWPGVIEAIGSSAIPRFDVFLIDLDDRLYLFSLFEFVGKDFARDLGTMAKSPVNRRWWKVTDTCQQPLPTAAARKEIWEPMETVGALAE